MPKASRSGTKLALESSTSLSKRGFPPTGPSNRQKTFFEEIIVVLRRLWNKLALFLVDVDLRWCTVIACPFRWAHRERRRHCEYAAYASTHLSLTGGGSARLPKSAARLLPAPGNNLASKRMKSDLV